MGTPLTEPAMSTFPSPTETDVTDAVARQSKVAGCVGGGRCEEAVWDCSIGVSPVKYVQFGTEIVFFHRRDAYATLYGWKMITVRVVAK
jgi:hypothetical protein